VEGGIEEKLPIPKATQGTLAPDGRRIAYNPLPRPFDQWKRYRGGRVSQIWLFTSGTNAMEKIPQPTTRSNDVDAMWIGDIVYFRSDRDGEFNIWAYDCGQAGEAVRTMPASRRERLRRCGEDRV
jgi:tricorn protease